MTNPANVPARSAERKDALPPLLKLVLELGPLVAFFVTFTRLNDAEAGGTDTQALIWATGVFMAALAVSLGVTYALTRTLSKIAMLTAAIVAIMGGLTIALEDETFIKMKPTIVNGLFATILGYGLLRGQSFLKYMMKDLLPIDDAGWMKLTVNWAIFFLFLAVLNEIVWRGFSTETWVNVKTFVNPILTLVFTFAQAPIVTRHALEEPSEPTGRDA